MKSAVQGCLLALAVLLMATAWKAGARENGGSGAVYVGSDACGKCHPDQYERFSAYAKKAHSYQSVEVMRKGLTAAELEGCYRCHTTGHGRPGGFVSVEATPHLKNNGCETCHGPASVHVETEDPEDIIGQVEMESCAACHDAERVNAFKFKPMTKAGAH
jgi:hypothetical protein